MSSGTFPYGSTRSFVPARVSAPVALDDSDNRPANNRWGNSNKKSPQLATTSQPGESDVWWQREVEIRELQEANKNLLQRVCTSHFEGAARQRGARAAAVQPVWPLPLPFPTPSVGSTAVAGGPGVPANVGLQYNSDGGINIPPPDDETLPPKGSARAALALLHDGQRLANTVAQLHEEVVELRQEARDRESEFNSQRSRAQRFCEALASVEERNTELRNENDRLHKVRDTFEHQGGDGLDYSTLTTYINKDLASIRADRHDAEAVLRSEVKQWEDTSSRLEVECRHVAHRHETMVRRLDTVHAEHRSTKWAAEEAVVLVDESVEHRTAASETAMRVLRQQFEIQAEEHAKGMGRLRQAETDVMAHSMLCSELKLRLVDSEQSHAASWRRFGEVQSEVEAREALQSAEHREMRMELEEHQIMLAEERNNLRRDVARQAAEYQTRDDEMCEEAEQAVARARDMYAKLSASRQDQQRAEGKLRDQLQQLQAEWRFERESNGESQEAVKGWGRMQEELSSLRSEGALAEAEFSSIRQKSVQTGKALKQENESLQRKMHTVTQDTSQRIQTVIYEERERCTEEAWENMCAVETRHCMHLSQLQEARDREVLFLKQAADKLREEAMAFKTVQRQLQEELTNARADECSAARQHAALLDALHREREAADSQLQQMLRQAEGEKQYKLNRLHEAFADVGEELSPKIEPSLASTMATTWGAGTSVVSRLVSSSLISHAIAGSPRSMAPSSIGEQFTTASTVGGHSGVDAVLRSLTCERETRGAQRLAEDLSRLISGVEQQVRSTDWSGDCRRLLGELLAICEQAAVTSAEDELQLSASRGHESEFRSQKQRADARCTHLTRLESQTKAHEDEVADLESRLVAALAETRAQASQLGSLQASAGATAVVDKHCTMLQAELDEARAQLDHETKRAQDWEQSQAADMTAKLEARAAEEQVHGLESRAILENHAAEQVARLLEGSEKDREEFHSELMHLRRALQRGLTATSDEHGGAARLEARLKAQLDSIREDYMEAGCELGEAKKMACATHSEWEAACAQQRKDRGQEQRNWQHERDTRQQAHANDLDILAKEILQFQDERVGLEGRLKGHQEEILQLHATLQATHEAAEQEAEKAAQKALEHRRTEHVVTSLEFNEEAARELLVETEAQFLQELHEREQSHNHVKEQLHALREDRLRDKSWQGRQFEKLHARVEILEQTDANLERHAEHAESTKIKQAEEQAQRVEQLRRESLQLGTRLQDEQEQLANTRTSLVEVMTRFNTTEEECRELVSDKELADAMERSMQAEQNILQERLSGRHEAVRSAESLGQELANRLQALEEGPLREAIRARDELQQQLIKSASKFHANNQAVEHECMRMLPLLSPDGAKHVTDLQQSGALAAAVGIAKVFECVAQELASAARENADLRASLVAEQTSRRRRLTDNNSAAAPLGPPAAASSNSNNTDLASKLASAQKELIRAREKNLDLLNEKQLLEQRASELAAKHQKELAELRVKETAVSSTARVSSDGSSSARPANSSSGPENQYLRHQIKQLQQGKAKANIEAQEALQELENRCAALQTEMEEQRAAVTKYDGEQSQAQRRIKALERRNQQLEEKLKDQRQLMAEKSAIEDQLSMAAKQLEALLADEHKDTDLQRDLAELSKQFEHLHQRHRDQLAKADKQKAQLQHEEAQRSRLEEDFQAARQKAEAARLQETSLERSIDNFRAERATMLLEATTATSEVQQLLGFSRQEQQTVDSLRGDVQRLRGELGRAHESLEQVRESPTSSRAAFQRAKRTEADVQGAKCELEASEAARRRLQAEARSQTVELEELRLAVAAAEAAHQCALSAVGRPDSTATEQAQEILAIASARERRHERLGRNYEHEVGVSGRPREHLSICDAASSVVVCTAQKSSLQDANLSSSLTAEPETSSTAPSLAEVEKDFSEFARSIGFRGDIETLWAEAQARAAELDGSVPTQQHAPPQPRPAPVPEAAAQGPHSSQQHSLVQQDSQHRSRQQHAQQGYGPPQQPSFDQLDAHVQQALTYSGHSSAPLTADVDLRAAGKAVPIRGYPESPPGNPEPAGCSDGQSLPAVSGGAYPESPGAASNWDGMEQTLSGSLPRWAQEAFQHAQLCCEQQRFNEAVPLFRHILSALEDDRQQEGVLQSAVAEVWAHLGVAMQSLDRVAEAVESYQKAASLDPSLHVCFANLATLHAYLQERDRAVEYVERALALDSLNPTYAQIRSQLEEAATMATATESTAAGAAIDVATAAKPAKPEAAAARGGAAEAVLATGGSADTGAQN